MGNSDLRWKHLEMLAGAFPSNNHIFEDQYDSSEFDSWVLRGKPCIWELEERMDKAYYYTDVGWGYCALIVDDKIGTSVHTDRPISVKNYLAVNKHTLNSPFCIYQRQI